LMLSFLEAPGVVREADEASGGVRALPAAVPSLALCLGGSPWFVSGRALGRQRATGSARQS
jgi:hypothetical protein